MIRFIGLLYLCLCLSTSYSQQGVPLREVIRSEDQAWKPGVGYVIPEGNVSTTFTNGTSKNILPRTTFDVVGASFSVPESGYLYLGLSHRSALFISGASQFRISTFHQKPVNELLKLDRSYEPSRSELVIEIERGMFSLVRAQPNPRSLLRVMTPLGNLEADGKAFCVNVMDSDVELWSLEGSLRVTLSRTQDVLLLNQGSKMSLVRATNFGYDSISRFNLADETKIAQQHELANRMLTTTFYEVMPDGTTKGKTLVPYTLVNQRPLNSHRYDHWQVR